MKKEMRSIVVFALKNQCVSASARHTSLSRADIVSNLAHESLHATRAHGYNSCSMLLFMFNPFRFHRHETAAYESFTRREGGAIRASVCECVRDAREACVHTHTVAHGDLESPPPKRKERESAASCARRAQSIKHYIWSFGADL